MKPNPASTAAFSQSSAVPAAPAALRRVLGTLSLTSIGIGGIIGTGIFVMTGTAAKEIAGPAVIVSFLVAALACGCAALCYAELAARYPQAGSAYAYGRALTPSWLAWLIGWNLIPQYVLAASAIAQGWSHYFQDALLAVFGNAAALPAAFRGAAGSPPGGMIDLPALVAVAGITLLLLRGITPSVRVNHMIVVIKLAVVLLIIGVGAFYVQPTNWVPFAPFGWGGLQIPVGTGQAPRGMLAGAAIVFYAYLGFEALTNYSEESRQPKTDVPKSILRALAISTLLYVAMALVLTGMVPYDLLSKEAPVSEAFGQVGLGWVRTVIALGATISITSVLLIILLSLPRILLAISRDGILSKRLVGGIRPENGVPFRATRAGGVLVAVLAAFVPLNALGVVAVLSNMVTFVAVALLTLRLRRHPDGTGTEFRAPLGPIAPLITILMCVLLMLSLPWFGGLILAAWLAVGTLIYAVRSRSSTPRRS